MSCVRHRTCTGEARTFLPSCCTRRAEQRLGPTGATRRARGGHRTCLHTGVLYVGTVGGFSNAPSCCAHPCRCPTKSKEKRAPQPRRAEHGPARAPHCEKAGMSQEARTQINTSLRLRTFDADRVRAAPIRTAACIAMCCRRAAGSTTTTLLRPARATTSRTGISGAGSRAIGGKASRGRPRRLPDYRRP